MGLTGIRKVCEVSFDKHASEQPKLHVSLPSCTTADAASTDH